MMGDQLYQGFHLYQFGWDIPHVCGDVADPAGQHMIIPLDSITYCRLVSHGAQRGVP